MKRRDVLVGWLQADLSACTGAVQVPRAAAPGVLFLNRGESARRGTVPSWRITDLRSWSRGLNVEALGALGAPLAQTTGLSNEATAIERAREQP